MAGNTYYCSRWCKNKKCPFNYTLKEEKKLRKKHPYGFQVHKKDLWTELCGYIPTDTRV